MSLEEDIRRGKKAEEILKHELVQEAFAHIEAEMFRQFVELKPSDEKNILFVKHMQYVHGKYKEFFAQVIANGKIAQFNLEAKKKTLRERIGL